MRRSGATSCEKSYACWPTVESILAISLASVLVRPANAVTRSATRRQTRVRVTIFRTDTKTKGVIEEVKLLSFAARKNITELILMNRDTIHVSLHPGPFQEDMGIRFGKGDEIVVTGSRVKPEGIA
jgi:hypothetical protein